MLSLINHFKGRCSPASTLLWQAAEESGFMQLPYPWPKAAHRIHLPPWLPGYGLGPCCWLQLVLFVPFFFLKKKAFFFPFIYIEGTSTVSLEMPLLYQRWGVRTLRGHWPHVCPQLLQVSLLHLGNSNTDEKEHRLLRQAWAHILTPPPILWQGPCLQLPRKLLCL